MEKAPEPPRYDTRICVTTYKDGNKTYTPQVFDYPYSPYSINTLTWVTLHSQWHNLNLYNYSLKCPYRACYPTLEEEQKVID